MDSLHRTYRAQTCDLLHCTAAKGPPDPLHYRLYADELCDDPICPWDWSEPQQCTHQAGIG